MSGARDSPAAGGGAASSRRRCGSVRIAGELRSRPQEPYGRAETELMTGSRILTMANITRYIRASSIQSQSCCLPTYLPTYLQSISEVWKTQGNPDSLTDSMHQNTTIHATEYISTQNEYIHTSKGIDCYHRKSFHPPRHRQTAKS